MSPQKALLGILLLFFVGIIAGFGLSIRIVKTRTHAIAAGTPEELGALVAKRLGSKLSLDPRQRIAVQQKATEALREIRTAREALAPLIVEKERASHESIRALLKPEQQAKFDALVP